MIYSLFWLRTSQEEQNYQRKWQLTSGLFFFSLFQVTFMLESLQFLFIFSSSHSYLLMVTCKLIKCKTHVVHDFLWLCFSFLLKNKEPLSKIFLLWAKNMVFFLVISRFRNRRCCLCHPVYSHTCGVSFFWKFNGIS